MEDEFMYQLARKLMVPSSSHEMKEVLEDYKHFSADGEVSEHPKDIVKSLDESGHKALLFFTLLGLFFVGNACIFAFIGGSYRLSFFSQYVLLFFLILLFPPFLFWAIGNKLLQLSKFYSCNFNQKSKFMLHI